MRCGFLYLCWALVVPHPATAASSGDAWTRLGNLPNTATVTIDLRDGRALKGTIQSVTAESLGFLSNKSMQPADTGGIVRLNRQEIRRIRRRVHGRAALIGAGIGAGAGAAYGAASWSSEVNGVPTKHSQGGHAIEGAAIFGVIGACVMAIVGVQRTLYDSPSPH